MSRTASYMDSKESSVPIYIGPVQTDVLDNVIETQMTSNNSDRVLSRTVEREVFCSSKSKQHFDVAPHLVLQDRVDVSYSQSLPRNVHLAFSGPQSVWKSAHRHRILPIKGHSFEGNNRQSRSSFWSRLVAAALMSKMETQCQMLRAICNIQN